MSNPSEWPLSKSAKRILATKDVLKFIKDNVLFRDCYATAIGFYPSAFKHKMQRKHHDDYLVVYCSEGKGTLEIEGNRFEIGPGDLFILPPNIEHRYSASEEKPWSIFWCHFQGQLAADYFEHIGLSGTRNIIRNLNNLELHATFQSLVNAVSYQRDINTFIYASSILRNLLTLTAKLRARTENASAFDAIESVQTFMRENLDKKLRLEQLAKYANLSKFHFSRRYKMHTSLAPLRHFELMKMEHACLMLAASSESVATIADQLGFEDSLYFSRVFKKVTGVSPSNYRDQWGYTLSK